MAKVKESIKSIKTDSSKLGLSNRVSNILESNGILRLRDLLRKSYWELARYRGFGASSERELREALSRFGLRLKDDPRSYQIANPCPLCGHKREDQNVI